MYQYLCHLCGHSKLYSQIWFTTHIKFIRYFSEQGNDGDVAAKDESQASIAQLAGYAAGISLLTFSHSPAYLYSIFFLAVPLHLTMTAYMMRGATFELLTLPRASYLAQTYASDGEVGSLDDLDNDAATGLFGEFYKHKNDRWLTLAPRVSDVLSSSSDVDRSTWQVCSRVFQVRNKKCVYRGSAYVGHLVRTIAICSSLVTRRKAPWYQPSSIRMRQTTICFAQSSMRRWYAMSYREARPGQNPSILLCVL